MADLVGINFSIFDGLKRGTTQVQTVAIACLAIVLFLGNYVTEVNQVIVMATK